MEFEVLISGVAGQGIQLVGKALATAALASGREAMLAAEFGGAMRGGHSLAAVVVGDGPLRALPVVHDAWSGIALHHQFWDQAEGRLRKGAVVVVNSSLFPDEPLRDDLHVVRVPATAEATAIGAPGAAGFVILGAYDALTGMVGVDALVDAMREVVPPYRRQHVAANEAALRRGAELAPRLGFPAWSAASSSVPA